MESRDIKDSKGDLHSRIAVLRQLVREGVANTQEDLCQALKQRKFEVTQSTISRDLRRIGAIKTVGEDGETIYQLPTDHQAILPQNVSHNLGGLLVDIQANESMVVLHTSPGSASLVARHLDSMRVRLGIMGTLAGDDTIFIAPSSSKKIDYLVRKIKEEF